MKASIRFVMAVTALLLAACDGGSSSPAAAGSPPPPPVDQAPGGLWFGTVTFDTSLHTEEFVALSSDDGLFRLVSVDSAIHFAGQARVSGTSLAGNGRAFADTGVNWLDGNHVVDVTISGLLTGRDSMSGSWVNASGESGSFEFFYDPLYEKDSATALLEAVWTGYDEFGNPELTFTVDANGSFTAQNTFGCVSNGQVTPIDVAFNLYSVQSEIANCAIAGSYTGLAFLADLAAVNDALAVSIDDGQRSILMALQR